MLGCPASAEVRRSPDIRRRFVLTAIALQAVRSSLLLGAGCAAPAPRAPSPETAAAEPNTPAAASTAAPLAEQIRQDPRGYLEEVLERCTALAQYTMTFTREERRGIGIFNRLQPPEHIRAWYRQDPLSIRFLWLDDDIKYGESTYVAGQLNGKVRFRPRHGLFGLPPATFSVAVGTPVAWGEARSPVTDFGFLMLMTRTLQALDRSGDTGALEYLGPATAPPDDRPTHAFRITADPELYPDPIQELHIAADTELPTYVRILRTDGALAAAYRYDDPNTNVDLTDEDFWLAPEREPRAMERSAE